MKFHGYELVTDWKNSQCGQTAAAVRAGKKYFLKKYQTPVAPIDNGTLDAKTFAHNEKLFNEFVDTRKRVNMAIRTIAGSGGNIVYIKLCRGSNTTTQGLSVFMRGVKTDLS